MLEKLSNEAKMSALADEMRAEIVWLAGPKMLGDSEKTLIGRAARAAGIVAAEHDRLHRVADNRRRHREQLRRLREHFAATPF